MAVSHVFPYPKNPVCIFEQLPQTLSFQRENREDGPEPHFFMRKCATGSRSLFFHRESNEKVLYIYIAPRNS